MQKTYNLQKYSLIKSLCLKYKEDYQLKSEIDGFYYLVLEQMFNLQPEEIEDCITDTKFISEYTDKSSGHDRQIDAVFIETGRETPTIHLMSFKHCGNYNNTLKNFPATGLDTILSFIQQLCKRQFTSAQKKNINFPLAEKVEEIQDLLFKKSPFPNLELHLVTNSSKGLEKSEKARVTSELKELGNFQLKEVLALDIVDKINTKGRPEVNAKVMVSEDDRFIQNSGDMRALILTLKAKEVVRILLENDDARNHYTSINYDDFKDFQIEEGAFEDNVRLYLNSKGRINQNIIKTLKSEKNNSRFFYYNNGITITCKEFSYIPGIGFGPITLKDIQVVNGSQTIHAIYEVFKENHSILNKASLLVRIYEIRDDELTADIARYTNSQNPVNNRDIKAIDYKQKDLESELKTKNYYYERKKNQYAEMPKKQRLDSEKVGQILLSFYHQMAFEAKNDKANIFDKNYDLVFNDDLNAERVLLAVKLYDYLEEEKKNKKREIYETNQSYEEKSYLLYSSFYTLSIINHLAEEKGIELLLLNLEKIKNLYSPAIGYIEKIITVGKANAKEDIKGFAYPTFFKSPRPKEIYYKIREVEKKKGKRVAKSKVVD